MQARSSSSHIEAVLGGQIAMYKAATPQRAAIGLAHGTSSATRSCTTQPTTVSAKRHIAYQGIRNPFDVMSASLTGSTMNGRGQGSLVFHDGVPDAHMMMLMMLMLQVISYIAHVRSGAVLEQAHKT
jgi:hypothetical protein